MSTTPYYDPCPPPVFPPDILLALPAAPQSYGCYGLQYSGYLLNENLRDFILQEDGASLIVIE